MLYFVLKTFSFVIACHKSFTFILRADYKIGYRNIAMAIVKSTKWKEALRHTNEIQEETTTPLRRLIKKMPGACYNKMSHLIIHKLNLNR